VNYIPKTNIDPYLEPNDSGPAALDELANRAPVPPRPTFKELEARYFADIIDEFIEQTYDYLECHMSHDDATSIMESFRLHVWFGPGQGRGKPLGEFRRSLAAEVLELLERYDAARNDPDAFEEFGDLYVQWVDERAVELAPIMEDELREIAEALDIAWPTEE
jgi:hypothetical protein